MLWPKRERNKDEKNLSLDTLLDSVPDMPPKENLDSVQDEQVKRHLKNILALEFDKDRSGEHLHTHTHTHTFTHSLTHSLKFLTQVILTLAALHLKP